jgi:hypothetical protein
MTPVATPSLWPIVALAIGAVAALALRPSRAWLARTRTAVAILGVVAVLAGVGAFVGQNLPPEAYAARYGRIAGSFLIRSGLTSVFTSAYFIVAVTALGLSILACTFGRIAGLVRAGAGWSRRLGILVTHVALVVIIAGGIVTAVGGFRRPADRYLPAGGEIVVPEGSFVLRVDEARTEFNDEGVVSEYVSEVTLIEDGAEVGTRRIEVNQPLVHRGIGVYQYEMLPAAESVKEVVLAVVCVDDEGQERIQEVTLPFRQPVEVPGSALSLEAVAFLSHFTYDIEHGTAALVSVRHENPAVLIQVSEEGRALGERWCFSNVLGHDRGGDLPCRFFLLDYTPDYEHGLTRFEFTRQPGTPLLYVGLAAMSLGLVLTFWARVPDAGRSRGDERPDARAPAPGDGPDGATDPKETGRSSE